MTWDILMGEGVVISAETNGVETNYTYGLERISAQTGKTRTEYIYDGRGSVAAEVSYNNAWYTLGGILSSTDVISKSYTPFGEQIGEAGSGFGYNGEYYNAATGMVYLRARFYEPEMNRFSQKDVVRGSIIQPGSLNRYSYVQNDPVNFIDPSGQSLKSAWNSLKNAAQNAVTSVKNTVSKVATAVKNVFTGGSSSSSNTAAPSKPPASSTGTKSSAVYYSTTRSSTTSSAVARSSQSSGTSRAYTPGPIQSTARNFNPNNIMQSTSQAIADARKAADYMNATAPGSPAARQATQAYQETVRLASMANSSNNPNIARQAYDTSRFAVNRANNVATGRLPNTYTPYDSNGNAYSYFNSSRQAGKTPSPDAPSVEDVSPSSNYCNRDAANSSYILVLCAIAVGEPTPIGELALIGYLGLIALGVIAIPSNIDLDDYQLPNIYPDPLPEEDGNLIEKMPRPGDDSGTKPEYIPLPEENHTGSTVVPLPEENTDLIMEQEITDSYKWGNLDTLEDHFNRHGNDVGAISPEDYARIANEFYNNRETYQVKVDEEGIIRVYDPLNNIFGAYNSDGTTKTLFSPTDGQSYFDRQDGELQ